MRSWNIQKYLLQQTWQWEVISTCCIFGYEKYVYQILGVMNNKTNSLFFFATKKSIVANRRKNIELQLNQFGKVFISFIKQYQNEIPL